MTPLTLTQSFSGYTNIINLAFTGSHEIPPSNSAGTTNIGIGTSLSTGYSSPTIVTRLLPDPVILIQSGVSPDAHCFRARCLVNVVHPTSTSFEECRWTILPTV